MLPSVGQGFFHSGTPCALGLCWFHTELPSSSLTSQQEWGTQAPGQAVGKALQKDFEGNVLVRCRNPPSTARGHGGSTQAAEGTNIPERQSWEVSLPGHLCGKQCGGSEREQHSQGRLQTPVPGRGMQGGTARCHLGSFSIPQGNCSPGSVWHKC